MQPQNQNPNGQPQVPPVANVPPVAPPVQSAQPQAPSPQVAPLSQQPVEQPVASVQPDVAIDLDEAELGEEEFDLSEPVNWQAKEFVHQEKDSKWFILFGIVAAVFMAVAIFLMQSWTFAALLVVIAIVIVVLAKRPPRLMSYSLSEKGLHIGDTLHAFSDFRAFGIIHDGEEFSIMLIPTKRFLPGITIYFPEEAGEEIVDALGSRLPMQDLRLDVVDRIVRKLRLG